MDLDSLRISSINSGACIGGKEWIDCKNNKVISSINPSSATEISKIQLADKLIYEKVIKSSSAAFEKWRIVPAPKRGDLIYQISLYNL